MIYPAAAHTVSGEAKQELLSIGQVAERTGLATSAIRFYEEQGLVFSVRNQSGTPRTGDPGRGS